MECGGSPPLCYAPACRGAAHAPPLFYFTVFATQRATAISAHPLRRQPSRGGSKTRPRCPHHHPSHPPLRQSIAQASFQRLPVKIPRAPLIPLCAFRRVRPATRLVTLASSSSESPSLLAWRSEMIRRNIALLVLLAGAFTLLSCGATHNMPGVGMGGNMPGKSPSPSPNPMPPMSHPHPHP